MLLFYIVTLGEGKISLKAVMSSARHAATIFFFFFWLPGRASLAIKLLAQVTKHTCVKLRSWNMLMVCS